MYSPGSVIPSGAVGISLGLELVASVEEELEVSVMHEDKGTTSIMKATANVRITAEI